MSALSRLRAFLSRSQSRESPPPATLKDAINQSDTASVQRLIAENSNETQTFIASPECLRLGILSKSPAIVQLLVDAGADIHPALEMDMRRVPFLSESDDARERDFSPLVNAVLSGHTEIVRVLLRAGADPNAKSISGAAFAPTPLRCAASSYRQSASMLRALVEFGGDVDLVCDDDESLVRRNVPEYNYRFHGSSRKTYQVMECLCFLVVCGARLDEPYLMDRCAMDEFYAVLYVSGVRASNPHRQLAVTEDGLARAKKNLQQQRIALIHPQATMICIALQSLELPAWVTLQIVDAACAPFSVCVPLHMRWALVTTVKHWKQNHPIPPPPAPVKQKKSKSKQKK